MKLFSFSIEESIGTVAMLNIEALVKLLYLQLQMVNSDGSTIFGWNSFKDLLQTWKFHPALSAPLYKRGHQQIRDSKPKNKRIKYSKAIQF